MPKFQVVLNFSFNAHHCDDAMEYESNQTSKRKQKKAFDRTDKFYEDHDIIEHIKTNDAMGMVEYVCCDAEVVSAEWDSTNFAINMVVETNQTEDELREDLEMNSLEDGEYEAGCETGWILFTRDEEGNMYDGDWNNKDVWEYGLVDYRQNPIEITEVSQTSCH